MIAVLIITSVIMIASTYIVIQSKDVVIYSKINNEYLCKQPIEEVYKEILLGKVSHHILNDSNENKKVNIIYKNGICKYDNKDNLITMYIPYEKNINKVLKYKVCKESEEIEFILQNEYVERR